MTEHSPPLSIEQAALERHLDCLATIYDRMHSPAASMHATLLALKERLLDDDVLEHLAAAAMTPPVGPFDPV